MPIDKTAPPRACDACLTDLLEDVEKHPSQPVNGYFCPHRGCMSIVDVADGDIILWRVSGPISYELAIRAMGDALRVFTAPPATDEQVH